jgi:hypothetical protein
LILARAMANIGPMKSRTLLVTALVAALASSAALAQPVQPLPPGYVPEKIGEPYLKALAKLPDWNGRWRPTSGAKPRPAEILFDPFGFYNPPDPAPPEDEGAGLVGPMPGAYLTGIPYNAEWKAKYEKIVKDTLEGRSVDNVGGCIPYGFPRIMGGNPSGPEIFMTPEVVLMYFDAGSAVRHIYIDGRGHPKGEAFDSDVSPRWNGHSIGRWEGDTLVVDTVGLYPSNYDQTAAPHSDQLRVTERIRQVARDWLEVEITMDDPVAFTRPWKVTRWFRRDPVKWPPVADHTCAPDEFIDLSKGYQTIVLPGEREADDAKK